MSSLNTALFIMTNRAQTRPLPDIQDHLLQSLQVQQEPSTRRQREWGLPIFTPSTILPSPSNDFNYHHTTTPHTPVTNRSGGYDPTTFLSSTSPSNSPSSTVCQSPTEFRLALPIPTARHSDQSCPTRSFWSPSFERTQDYLSASSAEFSNSSPPTDAFIDLARGQEHYDSPYPLNALHADSSESHFGPDSTGACIHNENTRRQPLANQRQDYQPQHSQPLLVPLADVVLHGDDQQEHRQQPSSLPWPIAMTIPTRFLRVSNVAKNISIFAARNLFESFGDVKGIFTTYLPTKGVIYLQFYDVRCAIVACRELNNSTVMQHPIYIEFCSKQEMSLVSRDILENMNDGIVQVSISRPLLTEKALFSLVTKFGDLMSFQNQPSQGATTILVEYFDTRHAEAALQDIRSMNQTGVANCQAVYMPQSYQPKVHQQELMYSTSAAARPVWLFDGVPNSSPSLSFMTSAALPSALQSRDGADLVATTTRLMDKLDMSLVVCNLDKLGISPSTSEDSAQQTKLRQASMTTSCVSTARAISTSATLTTIDTKGTDHHSTKAAVSQVPSCQSTPSPVLNTAISTIPAATSTGGLKNNKVHISRRARSQPTEGPPVTAATKFPATTVSSSPPTSRLTATVTTVERYYTAAHELANERKVEDSINVSTSPRTAFPKTISTQGTIFNQIQGYNGPNDKRTTFMIRNIPNKYTQQMLLDWINETHHGMFDFLYLRMDFQNKCNVGYAFINFVNVGIVESFAKAHMGKKWPRFNSDKICDLAYAAVQGRDALIEKFRNSKVMAEQPSYRPTLFYTTGPKAGEEEPFPEATVNMESSSSSTSSRTHGSVVRRRHSSKA